MKNFFQSLNGRPYKGRISCFGQTVYGLDPRVSKYRPVWKKGVWLGKDETDADLVCIDGVSIFKANAIRKISNAWDAKMILPLASGPSDFFGHRQGKIRIQALQPGLALPILDEEAEAVRAYAGSDNESDGNEKGAEASVEVPAMVSASDGAMGYFQTLQA